MSPFNLAELFGPRIWSSWWSTHNTGNWKIFKTAFKILQNVCNSSQIEEDIVGYWTLFKILSKMFKNIQNIPF